MQLLERIDFLFVCLSGNKDQRILVATFSQVPIHSIVAQVSLSANKPFCEWRPGIVQHIRKGCVPVNELGLLTPESFRLFNGATMKILIGHIHTFSSSVMRVQLKYMHTMQLDDTTCTATELDSLVGSRQI